MRIVILTGRVCLRKWYGDVSGQGRALDQVNIEDVATPEALRVIQQSDGIYNARRGNCIAANAAHFACRTAHRHTT